MTPNRIGIIHLDRNNPARDVFTRGKSRNLEMDGDVPPSISKFIDKLALSDPVKEQTKIIYSWLELETIPRQLNRKKYISHCIYQAYRELKLPLPSYASVAHIVDLPLNVAKIAINNKMVYKAGIRAMVTPPDPVDLAMNYAKNVLLLRESTVSVMITVFQKIIIANRWLLAYNMEEMVACFIVCYLKGIGYEFSTNHIYSAIDVREQDAKILNERMTLLICQI